MKIKITRRKFGLILFFVSSVAAIICCLMMMYHLRTMKMILNADSIEELEHIEATR